MIVLGASQIGSAELRPFVADGTSPQAALHFALVFAVWSYSGYDALAYTSEEIVEPERNYPRTLVLLLPLVVAAYVLPLLVALAVTPEWASWETAHYNQVAFALGGTWLALLTALAAQCSSAGLFYSELLITSRLPYALARDGVLPAGFARLHPRYGTPWVFLVAQAVLYSALVSFLDF